MDRSQTTQCFGTCTVYLLIALSYQILTIHISGIYAVFITYTNTKLEMEETNSTAKVFYKHKGKFVTKKFYEALNSRSKNIKNRRIKKYPENCDHEMEKLPVEIIKGYRIVDLVHMARQMQCTTCHDSLFLQDIESETLKGLASIFYIRCRQCLTLNGVHSSTEYKNPANECYVSMINTKFVLGEYAG